MKPGWRAAVLLSLGVTLGSAWAISGDLISIVHDPTSRDHHQRDRGPLLVGQHGSRDSLRPTARAGDLSETRSSAGKPTRETLNMSLMASAGAPVRRGDAGSVLLPVRVAPSPAVYLSPLAFDMGSSEEEVLSALVRCKREPLPDRCDEGTFESETPIHREQVRGFWMARTEVTVAQYSRCVAVGRCEPASYAGGAARFARPDYPVTMVTFDDAKRYCAFRGGRLPTEAEFERAARGAARRRYPWGQAFHNRLANHGRLGVDATDASDGFAELAPVGSFPSGATPEGIQDLAGNVAEWTADAFTPDYGRAATSDRSVRGGSFASAASFVRGAARAGKSPTTREPTLGFRCVWPVRPLGE